MNTEIILSASNVSLIPNGSDIAILDGIKLEIKKGEFVSIMGNSGAGKSTLLYCLSSIEKPTSGEIKLHGRRIDNLPERKLHEIRRKIGFVFQQINLLPHLTIIENTALAGLIPKSGLPKNKVYDRARSLLRESGIENTADRLPASTSGGQQQRAAVARALMRKPEIIFADEPTGALNSKASRDVLDLLSKINCEGQTVIMVTHDPKAAARAERVIYLEDGAIIDECIMSADVDLETKREEIVLKWLKEIGW